MWEFFRRYMEEGLPKAVEGIPEVICFPLDRGRERWALGWSLVTFGIHGPWPDLRYLVGVFFPFVLLVVAWRWIQMHLAKRPVWPQEVEDTCIIEPDDPHVYDVTTNPPKHRFGYC